jgi:Rieske 2Fe-2S family protein
MHDERPIRELIACQRPGWSLEQRFYTDPAIYRLELDYVLTKNWIFAGHESEFVNPGDFKLFRMADESAIVVRGEDGVLRAFANVCRHRGSLVCLEEAGNTRKFTCPYHGWMYNTQGELIAARNMPDCFVRENHGLHGVSVDTVHGLVFVCLSDDPPSLSAARAELADAMRQFDFPGLRLAATKTYPIAANWKLAVENYQEFYHCATAHPDYAKMHTLMLDPVKYERVQASMRERMDACGLEDLQIRRSYLQTTGGEQGFTYWRSALFEGYKTGSRDGQPVAPLLGKLKDYDGGASDLVIGPASFFLVYSDHVVGYVFAPVDQAHCECRVYWFVRGDAEEGKDYDVDELTWLWDITTQADEKIIVDNWKGVCSRYYRPGPFSLMESWEAGWVQWLLHELRKAPQFLD